MDFLTLFRGFFCIFLAVLPFAHTTALRSLVFVLLIFFGLGTVFQFRWKLIANLRGKVSWPWIGWIAFLLLHAVWISNQNSWQPMGTQWGQSALAWMVGIVAAASLTRAHLSFKQVALACSVIVGVYFLQLALALSGILGSIVPSHVPIDQFMAAIKHTASFGLASWGAKVPFPFVGYDEMHGNLGYAGTQIIALCVAWYASTKPNGSKQDRRIAIGLILASLLSSVWISSRGALIFDLIMLSVASVFLKSGTTSTSDTSSRRISIKQSIFVCLVVLIAWAIAGKTVLKDERWQLMATKMQAGWMVEDPVDYMCRGLRDDERERILQSLAIQDEDLAEKIMAGFDQDAGRVLLMQVGWQLVKENPLGIDGSRQAYEKAIVAKCGGQPVNTFAHTHNGWMNLALSLGWLGAGLYFALLASMAREGYKQARRGVALPWSSALFLVAFFWIIRGLTDACYQDHYLLMQGALLGFLYARTRMEAQEPTTQPRAA